MRSVMEHSFSQVPSMSHPRSGFNRSHGHKTTFNAGDLIPVFTDEVLPGDTFNLKMNAFARLATPIHPFMDNLILNSFFFFVPNRLLWDNWEKFNGAKNNPADSTDFVIPTITAPAVNGWPNGSLHDYFGIPTNVVRIVHNCLHHRAYNLIWNEWFRDENLQDSVTVNTGDGPDPTTSYNILKRGKRHDYFTSALPWPQKGVSVDLPLGTSAPVTGIGVNVNAGYNHLNTNVNQTDGADATTFTNSVGSEQTAPNNFYIEQDPDNVGFPNIRADLTEATAATVNQLREAISIQQLYEKDARGGTRYTEIVRSHFGVVSPDQRLQRPEYLGGGSAHVNVSSIPQTSSTDTTTPQGNLAAQGVLSANGHGFSKSFTEHGVIIGLVSVRADLNYQQGLNRQWSRSTRWDYYWPELANLGEQAVLNKEIYAQGPAGGTKDDEVFGYQERFAEYRYKPSIVTGKLRSNDATSLDTWHLAIDFDALPALNATFIQDDPPIERVIAVETEPHFIFDSYFDLKCARPVPTYGVPGLTRL